MNSKTFIYEQKKKRHSHESLPLAPQKNSTQKKFYPFGRFEHKMLFFLLFQRAGAPKALTERKSIYIYIYKGYIVCFPRRQN
jgi:hypothetical protein